VSSERGTAGSRWKPGADPGCRALLKDPFHRGLLRSVRGMDGETALHGRGSFASGPRFLFITTYVIDSVESPPLEDESNLSLGSILLKTRPVFYFSFILSIDCRVI
jgi:hypothetical protein